MAVCTHHREHPEVSEELCVEMMTRQLAATGKSGLQHQVLSCLVPWMLNLVLSPRWKGAALFIRFWPVLIILMRHQRGVK